MSLLPPLLLTSCISVSAKNTKIIDHNLRIDLTIKAIEKWLRISMDIKIVICDGSNYDFTPLIYDLFPNNRIECLCFNNNRRAVALYGKGYGEGEIINYALERSKYLKESVFFAKCTSKLWVNNYFDCLHYWNGTFLCDCDFSYLKKMKLVTFKSVDTAFYFVNKNFYINNFSYAYLYVREKQRHWLEHCFRDIIVTNNIKYFMFPIAPIVLGVSGTRV